MTICVADYTSASGPSFSPSAGSIASGTTVTDSCTGGSPYISTGSTAVAGATGIVVSSPETLYGSCQGSGYFIAGSASYAIGGTFAFPNAAYANGTSAGANSKSLSAFGSPLTDPSFIVVGCMGAGGGGNTFAVPTDTAGNVYVDGGSGQIQYNGALIQMELFYSLNTHTTSANVVTCNLSAGTLSYLQGSAVEITGAAASSPIDGGSGAGYSSKSGTGGSAGANALAATSITPAGNGDLILGYFAATNALPSAGTSPHAFTDQNPSASTLLETFTQASSAAIAATAGDSYASDPFGALVIAVKP